MDTENMIADIKATNLTHRQIADLLGCSKATIDAWSSGARGKRPSHGLGQKLIVLHKRLCKAK